MYQLRQARETDADFLYDLHVAALRELSEAH
jgi:hypothetical protein